MRVPFGNGRLTVTDVLSGALFVAFLLGLVLTTFTSAFANDGAPSDPAKDQARTALEIEKVKPPKAKKETLPFLRANKDFLRAQLDLLRQIYRMEEGGIAKELDPRYLKLQEMLAELEEDRARVAAGDADLEKRSILESAREIAALEDELARMDSVLARQAERLQWLDDDFASRQTTALIVLLRSIPGSPAPQSIVLLDDDRITRVPIDETARASLDRGGLVKLFHQFIEPREQEIRIGLEGDLWTSVEPVRVTIAPAKDKLNFLELDLASWTPELTNAIPAELRVK